MASPDVIVVGAGVAGLTCARTLLRAGLDVAVLETGDAPGGRVRTDVVDGFRLDRGFQVLPTSYPEARRELDYGSLELRPFARGAIVRVDGRFRRVADPRGHIVRGVRSLAGGVVTPRDLPGLFRLERGDHDETTTAEALRGAAISSRARDAFLSPFLRGITLDPRLETSSAFLSFVLQAFAAAPAALPARGMAAIPEQLADGLNVQTGAHVATVGPSAVTLESGRTLAARAVVVAAAGIVDEPIRGWNAVSCASFAAAHAPLRGPWLVLDGDRSGPVNNLCVPSEVAATYAPAGRALISASVLGAGDVDLDAVRHQLRTWFGRQVDDWSHLHTHVIPRALPTYPAGASLLRPPRLTPGLYACGDHREHPSLNGALASGRRAAEAVLADLA